MHPLGPLFENMQRPDNGGTFNNFNNVGGGGNDFNVGLGAGVNPWAFLILLYMSSRFNAVPQPPQPPVVYIINNPK